MGAKTKIIVLHMKEIIYTGIILTLGILLIVLLLFMFHPKDDADKNISKTKYNPGIYTSSFTLNNTTLEVEVSVDKSKINSIRFSNLDETITTSFPLLQPALEEIADQIYSAQSFENIHLSSETPYTSKLILNAITKTVEKAAVD